MTPEQHNKYLAISHFVYAGIFLVMMLTMTAFFVVLTRIPESEGGLPPFFMLILVFVLFGNSLMILPSMVAGFALLKKKSWAKIASLIGGVVGAMNFPLGTAVCVYTLWFFLSEPGKSLYDRLAASALPPAPPTWAREGLTGPRDHQFRPPDWR